MKIHKILIALVLLATVVALTTGCGSFLQTTAVLTANPQSGIPTIKAGGMEVIFAANGIIDLIDYGDDSTGTSLVHLYEKVGTYKAVATVIVDGNIKSGSITIIVKNDHPEAYPPFFAGSYPQVGGRSIIDGRKQQHGCIGGGAPAENYGAWPQDGEVFTYSWKVTLRYVDTEEEVVVYADGTDEYPLELIGWHVGYDVQFYPDILPVPTIYGVWIPPTLSPLDVCTEDEDTGCALEEDPWEGYPEYEAGPAIAVAVVEMTIYNQLGCHTTTVNVLPVYVGGGC